MNEDDTRKDTDLERVRQIRARLAQAERNHEPNLIHSRMGTRMVSLDALREQITHRFIEEHGSNSQALQNAVTEAQKLSLILATTDYVLSIESVQIGPEQKAALIRLVFADIFSFGPLDSLLRNPDITTISLRGAEHVAVRYGHGDLVVSDKPIFDTEDHLRRIMQRLADAAGVTLQDSMPIIEFGITTEQGRPLSVSIAGPPVTYEMTVDIRLHPTEKPNLQTFLEQHVFSERTEELLRAIATSPYGIVIVGDVESGKTSLLAALIEILTEEKVIAVEHAGALRLPKRMASLTVKWPDNAIELEQPGNSFGQRIAEALDQKPDVLILDEVRTDEAPAVRPLLLQDTAPRQIWAFRGPSNSKKLSAALSMLARRSDPAAGERTVHGLYRKLPFVLVTRRLRGELKLHTIAEWQLKEEANYPDFIELMTLSGGKEQFTGNRPSNKLEMEDNFWQE